MKLFRQISVILISVILLGAILFRCMPTEFRGHRLWRASCDGDLFRVRLFLLLGADVNYTCGSGSPLHAAAYNGDVKLIKILLSHGAIVDKEAKFGITPLYEARSNRHLEAERLLLSQGANPDTSHIHPP